MHSTIMLLTAPHTLHSNQRLLLALMATLTLVQMILDRVIPLFPLVRGAPALTSYKSRLGDMSIL